MKKNTYYRFAKIHLKEFLYQQFVQAGHMTDAYILHSYINSSEAGNIHMAVCTITST